MESTQAFLFLTFIPIPVQNTYKSRSCFLFRAKGKVKVKVAENKGMCIKSRFTPSSKSDKPIVIYGDSFEVRRGKLIVL